MEETHGLDKKDLNIPNEDNKNSKKQSFDNCTTCQEFKKHIQGADEARKRYRKEKERKWNEDEVVVSVKMQKVIMLPQLPGLKVAVFCKRIVLLNESFAPIGRAKVGKQKPKGVLWHDGIKGRPATDVPVLISTTLEKTVTLPTSLSGWIIAQHKVIIGICIWRPQTR